MPLAQMSQRKKPRLWKVQNRMSARDSEGRMTMRLHIARGSFSTACAQGECPFMDPAVWSRMPEDILWQVVLLLPAVKRFQLQLVSRKWRKRLTSTKFCNSFAAAAALRELEESVVACVTPGGGDKPTGKLKVLEIDLSFVPREFWTSDYYRVVAAGNGLVCISNDSVCQNRRRLSEAPWVDQYCLLNPLTRTFVVLPELPILRMPLKWLPPTSTSIAVFSRSDLDCGIDTLNLKQLASGGVGSGGWVSAGLSRPRYSVKPAIAQCGGISYWFGTDGLRLLVPGPGGELVDAVEPLPAPSVETLGLDTSASRICHLCGSHLVLHGGTVFLVANLQRVDPNSKRVDYGPDKPCGVWRLARDPVMAWEAVTLLDAQEVERATGVNYLEDLCEQQVEVFTRARRMDGGEVFVAAAQAAQGLVCCKVRATKMFMIPGEGLARRSRWCMVGFNPDTGVWEQMHDDQALLTKVYHGVELKPNLLLSQTDCQSPESTV